MRVLLAADRKTHFTERIPLLSIRSIRTDRHMAYTDRYGAGVLDNPHFRQSELGKYLESIIKLLI